jgi:hypothetical protein
MPSVPRNTIEDQMVEGALCTICGQSALRVVHMQAYPDYVTCRACGSAFVVEEGGERVLYGNIAAQYPETSRFCLKQWAWPEAIQRRALQERPKQAPAEPKQPLQPAVQPEILSQEGLRPPPPPPEAAGEEIRSQAAPAAAELEGELEVEAPPPEAVSAEEIKPPAVQRAAEPEEEPGLEAPSPAAVLEEEIKPEAAPPAAVILNDEELPDAGRGVPLSEPELPVASASSEGPQPSWDALRVSAEIEEDLTPEEPPESEEAIPWDRLGEAAGTGIKPASEQPEAPPAEPPAPSGGRRISLKDLASGAGAATAGAFLSGPGGLPESAAAPAGPGKKPKQPEWLQAGPPADDLSADLFAGPSDRSEEGVPMPDWMRTSPVSPIQEAKTAEEKPEEDTLWPYGGEEEAGPSAAELIAQRIQSSEPEPAPAVAAEGAPAGRKSKGEATSDEIGAVEPTPGQRYRVALRGDHVIMPQNVCAHCTHAPARRKLTIVGSSPAGNGIGQRQRRLFTLPLCQRCYRRATARSNEEKAARTQALLLSALISMIMVVGGLAARLVNLREDPLISLIVLGILAVIGFAFPAIFLLGRTGQFMPPPDAAYVRSTLLVPDDSQGLETAFEWRSEGYAARFRQSNAQMAVSSVIPVKDRSGISPTPDPTEPIPPVS